MKTLNHFILFGISILILSSCASIQQVADDDVYVSKNPALTTTEEVNDVSSYENFRYNKDRKLNRVRYGSTSAAIVFQQRYDNGYSPFNDPRYYNYGYGTVYGSAMYFQFGNFDTYHYGYPYGYGNPYYNPYYSPYYNPYYYGNSCYGNPYYNGYNNNYNSNGYNNQTTANNYHYGPRNTLSGVNNYGKRGSQKTLGISKKPNIGTGKNAVLASSASQRKEVANGRVSSPITHRDNSSQVKSSRPVSAGTGLTGSNKRVVTTNSSQRGTGTYNNSNSSRSHEVGTNSSRGTSSGSSNTRSSESGGGTFKSSGSSGGNTSSPRGGGSGSGSSTPTRRGGR